MPFGYRGTYEPPRRSPVRSFSIFVFLSSQKLRGNRLYSYLHVRVRFPDLDNVRATVSKLEAPAISRGHLEPAGLLNSLKEPWSGNLMLQGAPYTSLKIRGRPAKLSPDFNWQVIRFTRHPLLMFSRGLLWGIKP